MKGNFKSLWGIILDIIKYIMHSLKKRKEDAKEEFDSLSQEIIEQYDKVDEDKNSGNIEGVDDVSNKLNDRF